MFTKDHKYGFTRIGKHPALNEVEHPFGQTSTHYR